MKLTESVVKDAVLDWLKGLGYEILSWLTIARGQPAVERICEGPGTNVRFAFGLRRAFEGFDGWWNLIPRHLSDGIESPGKTMNELLHFILFVNCCN